ncbi:MAG: hypothetical protein QW680_12780 [Pyrobaculum sp.]
MFKWVKYVALIVFGYAVGKLTKPPQLLFNTVVTLLIFTVSASAAEFFINNAGVFITLRRGFSVHSSGGGVFI